MRRLTEIATVLLVVAKGSLGCAGHPAEPPKPTACNRADRHGVYLFEYATLSGNCGQQASGLVNFDDPKLGDECSTAQIWSERDCKLASSVRCAATISSPANEGTAVSTQATQDGGVLYGTVTIQVGGPSACFGTYSFHAVRQ